MKQQTQHICEQVPHKGSPDEKWKQFKLPKVIREHFDLSLQHNPQTSGEAHH